MTELPWKIRYAIAAHEAGKHLPDNLLMCVQIHLYGGGCAGSSFPNSAARQCSPVDMDDPNRPRVN